MQEPRFLLRGIWGKGIQEIETGFFADYDLHHRHPADGRTLEAMYQNFRWGVG